MDLLIEFTWIVIVSFLFFIGLFLAFGINITLSKILGGVFILYSLIIFKNLLKGVVYDE